jgi:hypothetical protein
VLCVCVQDPTERLALALGLEPRRLAIYTGELTTDSMGSVNALRYALAHPLVLVSGHSVTSLWTVWSVKEREMFLNNLILNHCEDPHVWG